jgi:hypothetical protein
MKLFRYRRPSLNTLLGVTKAAKRNDRKKPIHPCFRRPSIWATKRGSPIIVLSLAFRVDGRWIRSQGTSLILANQITKISDLTLFSPL